MKYLWVFILMVNLIGCATDLGVCIGESRDERKYKKWKYQSDKELMEKYNKAVREYSALAPKQIDPYEHRTMENTIELINYMREGKNIGEKAKDLFEREYWTDYLEDNPDEHRTIDELVAFRNNLILQAHHGDSTSIHRFFSDPQYRDKVLAFKGLKYQRGGIVLRERFYEPLKPDGRSEYDRAIEYADSGQWKIDNQITLLRST